ncbi:23S rRNA (uracil(1939)-C(5))-methyltransferase RlmD [Leucothrix pacifica]|uniref:23S rRNA (uracil(1939)-C(5))-methyltransferase RlmD n=1 Tax=Leucothrix pacifica TaxID=1247513 RepID=A0A317CDJ3_9GAMM|nr:23S rRNA (uracil(1939)-C(5))-methyltransferase RlmD [Leucothrix pacifica]PWQ96449.1 23S rRNA (uracil(1939)-C(5))-methyltransferase RlmD [Leucothrix pacifica]
MAKRRPPRPPQKPVEAVIESLSLEGKGITHIDGKTVFVGGALPGEKVMFTYTAINRKYDEGYVSEVLETSEERVEPGCPHFKVCGGCSMQHLAVETQIHHKQKAMLDALEHIGKVRPDKVFEPITGEQWGYRRKARLGVRYNRKKGKVLVGFRERAGRFLADIESCKVLHPSVGEKLTDLQDLIIQMDAKETIPQIEVAVGDEATALVFRHLEPLSDKDQGLLIDFAKAHNFQLYLQPKGPNTVHCIWPDNASLFYEHPDFKTKVAFGPQDFFQVNSSINRKMVPTAVVLLQLDGSQRVLDLFCGLGNFTLPIAQNAAEVVGVEGDSVMVRRAKETALANGINNTSYYAFDLTSDVKQQPWMKQQYDCILLDPPRSGAKEVIEQFKKLGAQRIVYVSCHPGTLARDADELVNNQGYRLLGAGVMDMFPHTAHVESIAVFEKP